MKRKGFVYKISRAYWIRLCKCSVFELWSILWISKFHEFFPITCIYLYFWIFLTNISQVVHASLCLIRTPSCCDMGLLWWINWRCHEQNKNVTKHIYRWDLSYKFTSVVFYSWKGQLVQILHPNNPSWNSTY